MNLSDALKFIKNQLAEVSGESALAESELILQHVLNCSRSELYIHRKTIITSALQRKLEQILKRRELHEPLPYIFRKVYFHSREFIIDQKVLIPRPDTEILVETVLESEKNDRCRFLEIGVGSGAVSAILIQERPQWHCTGTDISIQALRIAQKNCPKNVTMVCADLFSSLKPRQLFDFIVSNPPYISESEMPGLDSSVKDFEPATALYGGKDGLDFYRAFASMAMGFLKPGGRLYCEIGYNQGDSVITVFSTPGWKNIKVLKDLAGRPRVAVCSSEIEGAQK